MIGASGSGSPELREALLAEYAEVNENFRLLTDIRFKLLAFLPVAVAAALAAVNVVGGGGDAGSEARALILFLFGLVVTVALATYSARNDQIYVWLVERGEQIERALGIVDGSFGHRPNAWFEVSFGRLRWPVGHANSIGGIYAAAIALWLGGVLITCAQLAWGAAEVPAVVCLLAIAIALAGSLGGAVLVRRQRLRRKSAIVAMGERAIELAAPIRSASRFEQCERQVGYGEFTAICSKLLGREGGRQARLEEVEMRIEFYARLDQPARRRYGLERDSEWEADSQYVALLVDLPPAMLVRSPSRRWSAGRR